MKLSATLIAAYHYVGPRSDGYLATSNHELTLQITVRLCASLQRRISEGQQNCLELRLRPGSTMADLLDRLAIDFPVAYLLMIVNGRLVGPTQPLHSGDQVQLLPDIAGG